MFTGLIEEAGEVISFAQGEGQRGTWRLIVRASRVLDGTAVDDSIAVNGCCLTVVALEEDRLAFDLLEETIRLTAFRGLARGVRVNLERSLRLGDRLGGHFVSGHIDVTGEVTAAEKRGVDFYLEVRVPAGLERYLVYKGSIAIEGVSLTLAEVRGDRFAVWLIPHTRTLTNLGEKEVGSPVNLEFDPLAKHVEKLLQCGVVPGGGQMQG